MKQVRETNASKSIAAYVILNRAGACVATVQAHFADGGAVTVNVWAEGAKVAERNARALGYKLTDEGRIAEGKRAGDAAWRVGGLQEARAHGWGYDKLTSALSGLVVDGHKLTNHCSRDGAPKPPKGRRLYPRDFKTPRGYSLANYVEAGGSRAESMGLAGDESGYSDCYRDSGLKYLESIGYRVIQAI